MDKRTSAEPTTPSATNTKTVPWNVASIYGAALSLIGFTFVNYSSNGIKDGPLPNTIHSIDGWQYLGHGQAAATKDQDTVSLDMNGWKPGDPVDPNSKPSHIQFLRSTFLLNDSLSNDSPHLPYTSTFWFRGTQFPLDSPFLDVGKDWYPPFSLPVFPSSANPGVLSSSLPWFRSTLAECLCYKSQPVLEDFRMSKFCTADGGKYIWGFASSIAFIGCVLEATWCVICLFLWITATQRSELVLRGRSATGEVRNMVDLVGVVWGEWEQGKVEREIGGMSWMTDRKLKRRLERGLGRGREVRFVARDIKGGEFDELGLVTMQEGRTARRRLKMPLDHEYEYGGH